LLGLLYQEDVIDMACSMYGDKMKQNFGQKSLWKRLCGWPTCSWEDIVDIYCGGVVK